VGVFRSQRETSGHVLLGRRFAADTPRPIFAPAEKTIGGFFHEPSDGRKLIARSARAFIPGVGVIGINESLDHRIKQ